LLNQDFPHDDGGPDAGLIGQPGSRAQVTTPALILDLDRLEKNVAAMAAHCKSVWLDLRPHAKTHKSIRIAKLQVQSGAVGVCCATVGEAEVMAGGGIAGVLITSPVVQPAKIGRLTRLNQAANALKVVVDNPHNAVQLGLAAEAARKKIEVLIDFDVGLGRTGAASETDAITLARVIRSTRGLQFVGVQAYAGHLQHLADYQTRCDLALEQLGRVTSLVRVLEKEGMKPAIVSGGGTGTYDIDHQSGIFTELQAGSYAVMDVEYGDVELTARTKTLPFEQALFVATTVVSNNARGMVTTDAGLKRFATDGPKPRIASGAPKDAIYAFLGDEHGCVVFADSSQKLELGSVVECVAPHCDPTVNLYDWYHCVRGDKLVAVWPVDARGVT